MQELRSSATVGGICRMMTFCVVKIKCVWTARLLKGFLEAMNKEDASGMLHIVLPFTQASTGAGGSDGSR